MLDLLLSLDDETVQHLSPGLADRTEWRDALTDVGRMPRAALRNLPRDHPIRLVRAQLDALLSGSRAELIQRSEQQIAATGLGELEAAIAAGVVTLSQSGYSEATTNSDDVADAALGLLTGLLTDPSAHLLLDDAAASLAQALIAEGALVVPSRTLEHAGGAALGSGLVARLPAFTAPPVDELLNLRHDLRVPLTRYRAAVMKLATDVGDDVFSPEALRAFLDDQWHREVEPALEGMNEALEQHGFVRELLRGMDLRSWFGTAGVGGSVYLGLGTIAAEQDLLRLLVGSSATVGSIAHDLIRSATRSLDERRTIRQSDFYYLYEANQRLGSE